MDDEKNPNIELINISHPQELLDNYFQTGLNIKNPLCQIFFETRSPQNWRECLTLKNAEQILSDMELRGMEDGDSHCYFDKKIIQVSSLLSARSRRILYG